MNRQVKYDWFKFGIINKKFQIEETMTVYYTKFTSNTVSYILVKYLNE